MFLDSEACKVFHLTPPRRAIQMALMKIIQRKRRNHFGSTGDGSDGVQEIIAIIFSFSI